MIGAFLLQSKSISFKKTNGKLPSSPPAREYSSRPRSERISDRLRTFTVLLSGQRPDRNLRFKSGD